jgi:serine protease Do
MMQNKVWLGVTTFLTWMIFSFNVYAANLPEFTELVAENAAAVVNISTVNKKQKNNGLSQLAPNLQMPEGTPFDDLFRHFFDNPNNQQPQPYEGRSLGSGFVLSSDGYILTNHHVIKDAEEIIVRFSDRSEYEAKVLGSDERSDVALLKVEATNLKTVKLGDSTSLKVGEWVLAIGTPFGFDHSATAGIISALGRSLPSDSYVPFIQTDVAINPGNSGGPLFNLDGEVIGINSQIYSRTGGFMGVSFAIPMDVAMDVVAQIKSNGYVSRGWLGVAIQDVNRELAESFGLDKPQGAIISRVIPESPAAKAGFEAGDVILSFNGKTIESSSALPPIVGRTEVGKSVPVKVMRKNKLKTISVVIEQLPEEEKVAQKTGKSGGLVSDKLAIEVANLTAEQQEQLQTQEGVMVVDVDQGAAADAGIRRGDLLLSINNQKIKDADTLMELVADLPTDRAIPVLVQRGEGALFLALRLESE